MMHFAYNHEVVVLVYVVLCFFIVCTLQNILARKDLSNKRKGSACYETIILYVSRQIYWFQG